MYLYEQVSETHSQIFFFYKMLYPFAFEYAVWQNSNKEKDEKINDNKHTRQPAHTKSATFVKFEDCSNTRKKIKSKTCFISNI